MIIHGYNPKHILNAVLVSIPKDKHGVLTSSENYRGIALCSSISKLFDTIILSKFSKELNSSNLQFAFKEKHSTTLATTLLIETVKYYMDNNSSIYVCMLDASKAFDRVKYCELFNILLKRNIPHSVSRLLLDLYTRQSVCATWDGVMSDPFSATNGVRQGAILSPILFNLYMD